MIMTFSPKNTSFKNREILGSVHGGQQRHLQGWQAGKRAINSERGLNAITTFDNNSTEIKNR